MNVTDAIVRQCHRTPDAIALIDNGRRHTYRKLLGCIQGSMASMRLAGVRPGQHVAIDLDLGLHGIVAMLALARMGASVSSIRDGYPLADKQALLARHGAAFVIHEATATWDRHRQALPPFTSLLREDTLIDAPSDPVTADERKFPWVEMADFPWLLHTTSGTTGVRKGIAVTHAQLIAQATMSNSVWGTDFERAYIAMGIEVSFAKLQLLRILQFGNTLITNSEGSLESFYQVIQRDRPTAIFTGTGTIPYLMQYQRRMLQQPPHRCTSGTLLTVMGSTLHPLQLSWILDHFCDRVQVNMGSTEAAATAYMDNDFMAAHPDVHGILAPWAQMQAVDESDNVLPAGTEGMLRIKTPAMAQEYLDDPNATAASFRNGWFYPGDIGSIDACGFIRLSGRLQQVVNLGGEKINVTRIENLLTGLAEIREIAVVTVPDPEGSGPMVIAVVVPDSQNLDKDGLTRKIQHTCALQLGVMHSPKIVMYSRSLPRNSLGKVMLERLQQTIQDLLGQSRA